MKVVQGILNADAAHHRTEKTSRRLNGAEPYMCPARRPASSRPLLVPN